MRPQPTLWSRCTAVRSATSARASASSRSTDRALLSGALSGPAGQVSHASTGARAASLNGASFWRS